MSCILPSPEYLPGGGNQLDHGSVGDSHAVSGTCNKTLDVSAGPAAQRCSGKPDYGAETKGGVTYSRDGHVNKKLE